MTRRWSPEERRAFEEASAARQAELRAHIERIRAELESTPEGRAELAAAGNTGDERLRYYIERATAELERRRTG
jgi:hypothetical protein